jgi:hypothetical protein
MSRIFRLSLLITLVSLATSLALAQNSRIRRELQSRQPVAQKPQNKPTAAIVPVPAPVPQPQPQAQPPVPAGPPKPVDMPAVPPQVSFVKGQLLIEAKNSTLNDILDAVHKATGASIDISSGDTSERVVGRIGPGPARDVLTDLLNGSKFNYVMLSPAGDASALDKVILTPKTFSLASASSSGGSMPSMPSMPAPNGPVFTPAPVGTTPNRALLQQLQPQVMPVGSQPPTAEEDNAADNADDQDQNAAGTVQPTPEAAPQPAQPQNPASVQEQMIQELQRRYQDRINMQQKQNQPSQPPPNQ